MAAAEWQMAAVLMLVLVMVLVLVLVLVPFPALMRVLAEPGPGARRR